VWTRQRAVIVGAVVLVLLAILLARAARAHGRCRITQPIPLPVGNVNLTPEQQARVDLMARGAMLFVFFHETGHMLISELKLPATGPEEDTADEFAAFFLTDLLKAAPENQKDLFASIIFSGAIFLAHGGAGPRQRPGQLDRRAFARHQAAIFNILCIATGARSAALHSEGGARRRPTRIASGAAASDYDKKHAAWDALLEPHVKGFFEKLGGGSHMPLQFRPTPLEARMAGLRAGLIAPAASSRPC